MAKRINIILPDETISILNKVSTKGSRSNFIAQAVEYYVITKGHQTLREQLKTGYIANSGNDLEMAAEWFPIESSGTNKPSKPKRK